MLNIIKLLLGGSPCTKWSVAQHNNREITCAGEGWELFKNYKIALDIFKPDYFLYENNQSAAQVIKDEIEFLTYTIDLDMIEIMKSMTVNIHCVFDIGNSKKITKCFNANIIEFDYSLDKENDAQFMLRFLVENCYEIDIQKKILEMI